MKDMWMLKHRPKTLDDYITDDSRKELIKHYITEQNFQHLFLYGKHGTGKTSLAYLLKELLNVSDSDFKKVDASIDNSIEYIRNNIIPFVTTYPDGDFKIVLLDEMDRISESGQKALKGMMEEYGSTVRFILSTNNPHKVIGELKDRCTCLEFKSLNNDDMLPTIAKILKHEGIKIDDLDILDEYVAGANGSFRSLLNSLQANNRDGKLLPYKKQDANYELKAEAMLLMGEGEWDASRKLLCANLADDDYEGMYRFLYEHLDQLDKFSNIQKWKIGIVVIGDYLYRHTIVADKEINFAACLIKLSEVN